MIPIRERIKNGTYAQGILMSKPRLFYYLILMGSLIFLGFAEKSILCAALGGFFGGVIVRSLNQW